MKGAEMQAFRRVLRILLVSALLMFGVLAAGVALVIGPVWQAWRLQEAGKYAEAIALLQRYLKISETVLGSDSLLGAAALHILGQVHLTQGRYAEAEPLMRRSLTIAEKSLGSENPYVAISLNNLAMLLRDTNRYSEAEPLIRRAIGIAA